MKYAEYVQQIKHLKIDILELENILRDRPIKKWAYLLHDRDENEDGSPKENHIHVMMAFYSDQTAENIAKWFNDEPQYVEKNKHKRHAYENMCSYLVHETPSADGKFHYPHEDVKANFDFIKYLENTKNEVEEAENKKRRYNEIEDIFVKIANNQIPRLKIEEHLNVLERIEFKTKIEEAYRIRDEKLAREVDRDMNVMYFTGESGTGKTTVAKFMAMQKGYDVFVTGSSNDPLQGYLGQECIILDDVRGSDWKINDLLKFLDNNTNSLVKSRYSNKLLNDCKLIILTSVQDINELYRNLRESETEPIKQLMRRCSDYVKFTKTTMSMYHYEEKDGQYKHVGDLPNMTNQILFLKEHKSMLGDLQQTMNNLEKEPF